MQPGQRSPTDTLPARLGMAQRMIERGDRLQDTLAMLCHIVEAEARTLVRADILLVDHAHHCLRTGAAPGLPDHFNEAIDGAAIDPAIGTCTAAAALGRPVITPDIAADPGWSRLAHVPLGLGLVAVWSMPIHGRDGRVIGTFGTYFTERREPTPLEWSLVEALLPAAAEAIEGDTRSGS